jgi:hypothetical protein
VRLAVLAKAISTPIRRIRSGCCARRSGAEILMQKLLARYVIQGLLALLVAIAALPLAGCSQGYSGPTCGNPLAAQNTEECNPSIRRR